MSDDQLDARWHELVRLTEQEFLEHQQHPGSAVFDPDSKQLKLRSILRNGSYYAQTFAEGQILKGDLPRIARDFYERYRRETEKP